MNVCLFHCQRESVCLSVVIVLSLSGQSAAQPEGASVRLAFLSLQLACELHWTTTAVRDTFKDISLSRRMLTSAWRLDGPGLRC